VSPSSLLISKQTLKLSIQHTWGIDFVLWGCFLLVMDVMSGEDCSDWAFGQLKELTANEEKEDSIRLQVPFEPRWNRWDMIQYLQIVLYCLFSDTSKNWYCVLYLKSDTIQLYCIKKPLLIFWPIWTVFNKNFGRYKVIEYHFLFVSGCIYDQIQ
jgi:hypothetical protein